MTTAETPKPEFPEGFSGLLKLEGGDADRHQAKAEQVAELLIGIQRLAYLLAAQDNNQEIGERLKPSRVVRDAYALRCGTPQAGSYAMPLAAGCGHEGATDNLLDRIGEIWQAVASGDSNSLQRLFGHDLCRRILREVAKILPHEQEGVQLCLWTRKSATPARLDSGASSFVKSQLAPPETQDAVMTVTGELLKIDFGNRQITLLYPGGREIVCSYLPEAEELLLDSRKDKIQVTGRFVLDSQGLPTKMMDVTRIEALDLSPLVITKLPNGQALLAPMSLEPVLDEDSQQYLCIEQTEIGLSAFGLNREILFSEVHEQLSMLWQEYALEEDSNLDPQALALKSALLALAYPEATHAEK